MISAKSLGRIVGVLLLLHLAAGLTVPFILLHLLVTPPGFLASAAGVLQIIGVSLRGLMGYAPEMRFAMPLGLAYLGLAVWLMVKGFAGRHHLDEASQRTG